jgi:streptomycin 6-kinase
MRSKALAADAGRWIRDLPELVAGIERDWSIAVGRPYQDSTEAFVAGAVLGDGTPAVLKLVIPRAGEHARNEITALRLAGGEGCARLLRADTARGALLLERLGHSLYQLALPIARRHEILCAAAKIWRPAAGCGLPAGADKGRWLADFIAETPARAAIAAIVVGRNPSRSNSSRAASTTARRRARACSRR